MMTDFLLQLKQFQNFISIDEKRRHTPIRELNINENDSVEFLSKQKHFYL